MIRLIIGVIGMILTYSYRPPQGLGDAVGMLIQGRNFYLNEPAFLALMALFCLLVLFGFISMVRGKPDKK